MNALTPFSSWTDINGQKNRYWDGNHTSATEGCECFSEKTCDSGFSAARNIVYKCNCDTYLSNAIDHGVLNSTVKLPVMKLHYGGSITPFSSISYRLGPLVCSGKKTFYPSEFALEERAELKQEIQGFKTILYQFQNDTNNKIQSSIEVLIACISKYFCHTNYDLGSEIHCWFDSSISSCGSSKWWCFIM